MAIRRVRNRRRSSTLIANPRKRRNGLSRAVKNGTRRGMVRKTARRAYSKRRNPKMDLTLGLPIAQVGIGAAAAIALKQVVSQMKFVKDAEKKDPKSMLAKAYAPGLTFLAGAAGFMYGKGMIKQVSKWVAVTGMIMLVDDVGGAAIKKAVTKKPGTGGSYGYVDGLHGDLGGTFLTVDGTQGVSGAYVEAPSHLGFGAHNFS